jgi:N,N-dimethylformamidase
VRSDMVLTALESGGGVFSVGSIAYTAALSHNGYQNNIARLTGNVLRRFREPAPLFVPDPQRSEVEEQEPVTRRD